MNLIDLERHWNELARTDPMWAILTQRDKRGRKWDPEQFFRTGDPCVDDAMRFAFLRDVPARRELALDFGCGIGRLTAPLTRYFRQVVGVDISQRMIRLAHKYHQHNGRLNFVKLADPGLWVIPDAKYDFILSIAVLQHMKPEYALAYVAEFMRVLRRGGAAYFQLTHKPTGNPAKDAGHPDHEVLRRRHALPDFPRIEMYGVLPQHVETAVKRGGGELVEAVRKDGGGWVNYLYLAVKE